MPRGYPGQVMSVDERRSKQRAWRAARREEVNAYYRTRHWRLRLEVIEAYGGECTCCGEDTVDFLCLDHVNDDGAEHRREIGTGMWNILVWARDNGYPERLQLLCANCNLAKRRPGGCPHQRRYLSPRQLEALRPFFELFADVDAVFDCDDAMDPTKRQMGFARVYRAWKSARSQVDENFNPHRRIRK